jgi:hypothetical protein
VAEALNTAAERLRSDDDPRDPVPVLGQAAVDALAEYRMTDAA